MKNQDNKREEINRLVHFIWQLSPWNLWEDYTVPLKDNKLTPKAKRAISRLAELWED